MGYKESIPSASSSAAYEASRVAKAGPGRLLCLAGYNSGLAQFIQVHNASSVPANGAIPMAVMTVPTLSNFSFSFGDFGLILSSGITVCNSSTGPIKTIGAADCFFTVAYL